MRDREEGEGCKIGGEKRKMGRGGEGRGDVR